MTSDGDGERKIAKTTDGLSKKKKGGGVGDGTYRTNKMYQVRGITQWMSPF